MMVELSDCGGEIDQTAEEDPAGTTLATTCLGGGAAAVLMCRGLCPGRLGLWWVPPASQRLLGCLTGHTIAAPWTSPQDRCPCLVGQPAGSHPGSEAAGLHSCWPLSS